MDKREIRVLLENWAVGDLVSHRQARRGVVNVNWILKTAKGKYVLRKVTQFVQASGLKFELDHLTYLRENGFPYRIPAPIRTKSGELFLESKGSRFWIYEHIDGRDAKRFGYSKLRECAKMMAIYHRIIEDSGLDNGKCSGGVFKRRSILKELERFRAQILRKNKPGRRDRIFLRESSILIPLMRSLDGREYSKLPIFPLHRDISPENILWKRKKLVGLIDFENVGATSDTVVKDISVFLQYSCRDRRQKCKLDLKLAALFLREYEKHHRLSNKEIGFLPDITTAGSIEDFG